MRILFFLDYIQDVDVLLPLAGRAAARRESRVAVCFSDCLARRFPRACAVFKALSVQFSVISRWKVLWGLGPDLRGIGVLLTASESSLRPHAAAYALTLKANRLGIMTATVQHGFEQAGLTYFDEKNPPGTVRFASRKILIWGEKSSLHPQISGEVAARCIPVGCPKELHGTCAPVIKPAGRPFVVSVFENLHWHRYSEKYRADFVTNLRQAARQFSDTTFFVRPHPDQRWLARYGGRLFSGPGNLILADPCDPAWAIYSSASFFEISDAVITTPSTIVLDAARAGVPVAVVAGGLSVLQYEPLFIIHSPEDWFSFLHSAREALGRRTLTQNLSLFVNRAVISGNVPNRIVDILAGG